MAEKTYRGGCHCGKVRYEVELELGTVMACNCSMCQRKGSLLTFVARDKFKLLSGEDSLNDYFFNKHVINHRFCKHCGIHSFAFGRRRDGSEMAAINVRCLDDIDLAPLQVTHVDGKSF